MKVTAEMIAQVHVKIQEGSGGFCPFFADKEGNVICEEMIKTVDEWLAEPTVYWLFGMNKTVTMQALNRVRSEFDEAAEFHNSLYHELHEILFSRFAGELPDVSYEKHLKEWSLD